MNFLFFKEFITKFKNQDKIYNSGQKTKKQPKITKN